MATTTNYSWSTPDDTGLVKDGASNIRTLGSSVDTTLNSVTNGKNVGLSHITTQTFTSTTTINIDNVFTSTFDNYYVTFQPTNSSITTNLNMNFRAGGATTSTNLTHQVIEAAGASVTTSLGSTGFVGIIGGTTLSNFIDVNIFKPKLATNTNYFARSFLILGANNYNDDIKGSQTTATSFDGVQFTSAATITATVTIYGYRKS